MEHSPSISLEDWIKKLPSSRAVYPEAVKDRLKYAFWRFYTPYHSLVRDSLVSFGFLRHEFRQDFLLGKIAHGQSIKGFIAFLVSKGFGNHFIAWKDKGELVSLRYVENFTYQYHLRIFHDGEVRGHFEYTPECYPVKHLLEIGLEDRRHDFFSFLQDKVERV